MLVCRGRSVLEGRLFVGTLEELLSRCMMRFSEYVVDPEPVSEHVSFIYRLQRKSHRVEMAARAFAVVLPSSSALRVRDKKSHPARRIVHDIWYRCD